MAPFNKLVICLLFLTFLRTQAQEKAMYCTEHPAYNPRINIPLIRSWRHTVRPSMMENVFYLINYKDHYYKARDGSPETKYQNLDLFFTTGMLGRGDDLVEMFFQRRVKVYYFIGVNKQQSDRPASLPGWRSEGYADLYTQSGRPLTDATRLTYGIHQRSHIALPKKVYVFSKVVNSDIMIPTRAYVAKAMRGIDTLVFYHIRVAEADGTPFAGISDFNGRPVIPNTECPRDLHASWSVPHKDTSDPLIAGKSFFSWHPAWDPCYWCAYSHEHGSNPKKLMGYNPTFGYTALKNNREIENDEGFKGYVFESGRYLIYINVHVQSGQLRRVTAQYHTIALVIVRKSDRRIVFEVSHKGDFGFLAARTKGEGFIPLRREDEQSKDRQMSLGRGLRHFRTVNVISRNPDPRFKYAPNMIEGVYEVWSTVPICCKTVKFGGIRVDLKNPSTGISSTRTMGRVDLHRSTGLNVGNNRMLKVVKMTCGLEHCMFDNMGAPGITWPPADGVFYTDARGDNLKPGPGRGAVRQYVQPGFELYIHQDFVEATENGAGLYTKGSGLFADHGYGLDPKRN